MQQDSLMQLDIPKKNRSNNAFRALNLSFYTAVRVVDAEPNCERAVNIVRITSRLIRNRATHDPNAIDPCIGALWHYD